MKRHHEGRPFGPDVIYTATQQDCPDCGRKLYVYQVDSRRVQGIDHAFWLKRRDKRCRKDCPGARPLFLAPRDLRVVLPGRIYGLDVTLHVGERHLREGVALAQITRDLNAGWVPLDQRHTGRIFRDFVALTTMARQDDEALCRRLRAQGGIVLMCDGVQFDDRSPVLYLVWDALSGQPLFGERKPFRGKDDLVPLLERVRDMSVPVIGAVTDKEKGLVPAVKEVFPEVPYQFCHTHYLKNCALPLKEDTSALGASVRRRAEAVRKVGKGLSSSNRTDGPKGSALSRCPDVEDAEMPSEEPSTAGSEPEAEPSKSGSDPVEQPLPVRPSASDSEAAPDLSTPAKLTEEQLAQEVCELVRVNSRVSGKAPLAPPELERHERLESIREFVDDAKKKPRPRENPTHGRSSIS